MPVEWEIVGLPLIQMAIAIVAASPQRVHFTPMYVPDPPGTEQLKKLDRILITTQTSLTNRSLHTPRAITPNSVAVGTT